MTVTINGTTGIAGTNGSAGTPAVQGEDTNTGIFFPAADTVAVATGGTERVRVDSSGNVGIGTSSPTSLGTGITTLELKGNSASQTDRAGGINFMRYDGNPGMYVYHADDASYISSRSTYPLLIETNGSERMRITSAGNVGIGTSSPGYLLHVQADASPTIASTDTTNTITTIVNSSNTAGVLGTATNHPLALVTNNTEQARIDSNGDFLVGKTAPNGSDVGFFAAHDGLTAAVVGTGAGYGVLVNRQNDDGVLISLRQAGTVEGTISVSGTTVSYNPFLGSHSGALADWSRPDIKIGTVMDTIDDLLDYKVVVIDIQEDATTQAVQKRICYNGNGAIGSNATVEYEGQEYTGIIQDEREEPHPFNKHLKVKVNDTAGSKAVFGVFVSWGTDETNDGGVYNDMLVGAVGNYVIRMAAGQEPQIGDLVEADGNGCAVVQDDDIIRTKTVAKITSTIKQVTYDDGSFLVTCVLYCG